MPAPARKRPLPGSRTARIWEIADELVRRTGRVPAGRDVVDAYVAEGGNEGTGFTQYSHWRRAQAAGPDAAPAEATDGTYRMTVDRLGRLELPPALREAILLGSDGRITARVEDGELRLITPRAALRRLRAMARRVAPDGGAVVDAFIAEKRREAADE
jgi:hypothetical protein